MRYRTTARLRSAMLFSVLAPCACGDADAASMSRGEPAERTGPLTTTICSPAGDVDLPQEARESSGLARSATRPEVLWTHNDQGNEARLIATDRQGRLLQQVGVGVRAVDWEDLESGPCEDGSCLYIGDIGDNDDEREEIVVHVVPEPATDTRDVSPSRTLRARFPDGPRDAESLFVLPDGNIFIVTKGRRHDVGIYRYPAPLHPEETATLELVRRLFPEPENDDDRVTAATSTPDGSWVGIRTYRRLYIYEAQALVSGGPVSPHEIDLEPYSEAQGEGLAMEDDGTIWLSSEAANRRSSPELKRLSCALPTP